MPLIPLRPLMEAAIKHGFAQGAFNVNAVAQAKAAIEVMRCSALQQFCRGRLQTDLWGAVQILQTPPWKIKK